MLNEVLPVSGAGVKVAVTDAPPVLVDYVDVGVNINSMSYILQVGIVRTTGVTPRAVPIAGPRMTTMFYTGSKLPVVTAPDVTGGGLVDYGVSYHSLGCGGPVTTGGGVYGLLDGIRVPNPAT